MGQGSDLGGDTLTLGDDQEGVAVNGGSFGYLSNPQEVEYIGDDSSGLGASNGLVAICETCNEVITSYNGHGRRPKYHPEHRPSVMGTSVPRERAKGTTGSKGLEVKLKRIAADLGENIALVGALIVPILPVTGNVVMHNAEDVATNTVRMAKGNPAVLAALEKANQVGPGVAVGRFLLTMGIALSVDTQRIKPDAQVSVLLGVYKIYQEVHAEGGSTGDFMAPAPPTARLL